MLLVGWECQQGQQKAALQCVIPRTAMDSPSVAEGRQPRSSCWCKTLEDAAKTDGGVCCLADL